MKKDEIEEQKEFRNYKKVSKAKTKIKMLQHLKETGVCVFDKDEFDIQVSNCCDWCLIKSSCDKMIALEKAGVDFDRIQTRKALASHKLNSKKPNNYNSL